MNQTEENSTPPLIAEYTLKVPGLGVGGRRMVLLPVGCQRP